MKILYNAVGWIYKVVSGLTLIAGCFILTSLSFSLPFDRDLILTKINAVPDTTEGKIWCGIIGLVMIVVVFTYLYLKTKSARIGATIAFDNPDGEVSISMSAIEYFVMRVGKEFAEIKSLEPEIEAKKEGVDITLSVELWSGMNLPKMTEALQNVVKSQVQNILGIENVHSVKVIVSKIVSRDKDLGTPTQGDMFHEPANIPHQGEDQYQ